MMTKDEFLRLEQPVIRTRKIYVDLTGDLLTAILLSHIIDWHQMDRDGSTRLQVQRDGQLWLARTQKQWSAEIRLSEKQVHRCLGVLTGLGLIEQRIFKFNNAPIGHVRIVWDVLQAKVKKLLDSDGIDVM